MLDPITIIVYLHENFRSRTFRIFENFKVFTTVFKMASVKDDGRLHRFYLVYNLSCSDLSNYSFDRIIVSKS